MPWGEAKKGSGSSPVFAVKISQPTSASILDEYRRPEYQVRLKWRPNTVVFWDNRATSHYAVHDYGDFPREVQRVLIAEKTLPYEHY